MAVNREPGEKICSNGVIYGEWLKPSPSGEVRVRHAVLSVLRISSRDIQMTDSVSVIPWGNGIQIKGMGFGMDPGFHRGDDKARMTETKVEFQ